MYDKTITLRNFSNNDQERILDILTSEKVNKTYMLPDYETRADAIPLFQRLMDLSHRADRYVRCIALNDEAIGYINDVETKDSSMELGYVIHPEYHNCGYMTQALSLAIKELFEKEYRCIICGAFEENKASQRVMEKCGLVRIAHTDAIEYRGTIHNCVYYVTRNEASSC